MNAATAVTPVLALLCVNAVLGAWDTLWYHEYRGRLTAKLAHTRPELRLHAARDAVYVVLYGCLAWWQPTGTGVAVIGALLAALAGIDPIWSRRTSRLGTAVRS